MSGSGREAVQWLDDLARYAASGDVSRRALLRRGIALFVRATASVTAADRAAAARALEYLDQKTPCPPGDAVCSDSCVNLATNNLHCGRCGHACPPHGRCINGACVDKTCAKGETLCDGKCVKLDTHPDHCGMCGYRCPAGGRCVNGACVH